MRNKHLKTIGLAIVLLMPLMCQNGYGWRSREKAEKMLLSGEAAFQDGLYGVAAGFFEEYVDEVPAKTNRASGVVLWAKALLGEGNSEKALEVVDKYRRWASTADLQARFKLIEVQVCVESNDYVRALEILDDMPDDVRDTSLLREMMRWEIRCYLGQDNVDSALGLYADFQEQYGETPDASGNLLEWAGTLIDLGRITNAVEILEELRQQYPLQPETIEGQLWLAQLYVDRDEMTNALDVLEKLTLQENGNPDIQMRSWYVLAQVYEAQTNYAGALEAISNVLKNRSDPELAGQAEALRAGLLIKTGETQKGINLLHQWVARDPANPLAEAAMMEAGQQLLADGENVLAEQEFQTYLETFANRQGTAHALLGKAWSIFRQKRYAEAATTFEKAYENLDDPEMKKEALLNAADAYYANGQYKLAQQRYMDFTQEYPGSDKTVNVLFRYAECLVNENDLDRAENSFRSIVENYPQHEYAERALTRVAHMREKKGDFSGAVEEYNRLMANYPDSVYFTRALHGRGLASYRLGLFPEALQDFTAIGEREQTGELAEQAFYMRGWTLYLMEQNEQALEVCRAFIEKYPESRWASDVLFWLAEYNYNHGNYEKAQKAFADLADRYADEPLADDALYWAGRSAAARHEYLEAIEFYNRLTTKYPDSSKLPEARFAQGDALSELGQFAGAILAFDEVIKNYPDSYLTELAMGRKGDCQFTLGTDNPERYSEAMASYAAIPGRDTASAELILQAEYKIGKCQEKLGRTDEALEQFMKVVYSYMSEKNKTATGALWFTRAAFDAAAICEDEERWQEASNIYRRVMEAGVPAAREAQSRMQRLQIEHWFFWD